MAKGAEDQTVCVGDFRNENICLLRNFTMMAEVMHSFSVIIFCSKALVDFDRSTMLACFMKV